MNPEIKQKWIAALESGEYQKGQSKLRVNAGDDKFKHCCLGVLCELHKKETGRGDWHESGLYKTRNGSNSRDYLPLEVAEWAGIDNYNGGFAYNEEDLDTDRTLGFLRNTYGVVNLALANDLQTGTPYYDPTYNTVKRYIKKYF